ncbi:MAG TPA: hypothetical protein VI757_14745 [Bacteroidia bacterium]|nr:hypothetical protein [Bacteroidia bacterium]
MKKYLIAIAAIAVMSLTSCYVRVRESHPHPRARVIIHAADIVTPKDSLQSNSNPKDSLQAPVNTEPVK